MRSHVSSQNPGFSLCNARLTDQKFEDLLTTMDELTLPARFITLQSEPDADNDQLGGNLIFTI
jgi:hypothetical protein